MQKNYKIINTSEYNLNIYNYVYNKLNKHDKEKIKKMPYHRTIHFILGRYLMLQEGLDISKITYNKNNKPLIDNVYFSISHSDKYTVFIYDKDEIGIDIEHLKKVNDDIKLVFMNTIVSDYEFLKYMTKKESYIKLNGYALKNFNDSIDRYIFNTYVHDDYIITICKSK